MTELLAPAIDEPEEELSEEEIRDQEMASKELAIWLPKNSERTHQRRWRKRIRQAFDERLLEWCCNVDAEEFERYGARTDLSTGHHDGNDFYFYQNNNSPVLAVAHLDSVERKQRHFFMLDDKARGRTVHSPTLDDRLGAYVILELLPRLNIKTDILLTVGEEVGASTAQYFTAKKQYNWMFQFDRMGEDVVMYQYDTLARRQLLRSVLAQPSPGMFSDISFLDHLGCAGFNWGVGYHDYHGPRAWASLTEMTQQVARFCRFHERYRELRMEHVESVTRSSWRGSWRSGYGELDWYWSADEQCWVSPKPVNKQVLVPEFDEQLKGRKRGSRRKLGKIIVPGELDSCPDCGITLEDPDFCEICGWGRFPIQEKDSVYGMTEAEWRQFNKMAAAVDDS